VTYGNRFANGYLERDWTGVGISTKFDFIIIHESAHEWFGHAVTASDVCDEWIHEAGAPTPKGSTSSTCSGRRMRSRTSMATRARCGTANRSCRRAASIACRRRTCISGRPVINTLRSVVDDDGRWWRIVRAFFDRFKYKTIATADVVAFFSKETGKDLRRSSSST